VAERIRTRRPGRRSGSYRLDLYALAEEVEWRTEDDEASGHTRPKHRAIGDVFSRTSLRPTDRRRFRQVQTTSEERRSPWVERKGRAKLLPMLRIITEKFCRPGERYETLHRATFYANYRMFGIDRLETTVGVLLNSAGLEGVSALTCEMVEKIEKHPDGAKPGVMISTDGAALMNISRPACALGRSAGVPQRWDPARG
jgi:hypothetical protein